MRACRGPSSAPRSYLTGAGLLGLRLGALLRSTPAAISTLFGALFLLGGVAGLLLPDSWRDTVGPYLPSAGGRRLQRGDPAGRQRLSPWAGLAVFLRYLARRRRGAAAWRLKRQDA